MLQVGDAVRLRDGSDRVYLLGAAADMTGVVGDAWSDGRGACVSVVYEAASVYVYGVPASEFVRDVPLDAAPF